MRVIVEVREETFRTPKTAQQIAEDVRLGAAMLWLARGDVGPEAANDIVTPPPPEQEGTLMDLLLSMPDVGEDADFERPVDYGRPVVDLD
jgi:hypothetical protein